MKLRFSSGNHPADDDEIWEDADPYNCFMDDETIARKASSSMDCTGLIPALPDSEEELEAYAQMYRYPGDILED